MQRQSAQRGWRTFALNGFNDTIAYLTGGGTTGGNVTLGSGTLTLSSAGGVAFDGDISGAGGFTLDSSGKYQLSGTDTYTGATTVQAGTLQLTTAAALPSGGAVSVGGGVLDLYGKSFSIGSLNGSGSITNSQSPASTLTVSGGGAFSGVISDGPFATTALTVSGGTLVLSGANTYTGTTVSGGGTLQFPSASPARPSTTLAP